MNFHERVLVVCDFDGTVCTVDMGNKVLNRFTGDGWEEIDRAYCAGEIGSRVAYSQICSLFKGTKDNILEYVVMHERLDPYFADFYYFCRQKGFDLKIVSDGLDIYIDAILRKNCLDDIIWYSNVASFREDQLHIEFPQMNEECERCGTCKSNILKKYRQGYTHIVYVGDGYSDFCPSGDADLVFAKGVLYEKCMNIGRGCVYYENFKDVRDYVINHI
jgi:2-hydroxy-3-keto-5-methylthiopentenyl-1-phosphate phosphatase